MFRFSESVVTIPDFLKFGLSGPFDSPDFFSSEIQSDRIADFVITLHHFLEIGSKKSADSRKSFSGTTA